MKKGWLFDIYPDYDNDQIVLWLKTENGPERLTAEYYPTFYVHGALDELRELKERLRILSSIKSMGFERKRIHLGEHKETELLSVTMSKYSELRSVARIIDASGDYRAYKLYNVDFELAQRYLCEQGVFPFAYVEVDDALNFELLDDRWALDYAMPPLKTAVLSAKVKPRKRIPNLDDPLAELHIDDITLEGEEREVLIGLVDTVKELDPDVIYTDSGDTFLLPYLYHRARTNELSNEFQLGREAQGLQPTRKGKSYFTYGQIRYRAPYYGLKGRVHLDRKSSFMYVESSLYGLIDIARISGVPLQTSSRVTPGTAISTMQVNQAVRDGYLVLWKKNIPERFKTAEELLVSDRGGFIYDPKVGIHDGVVEIDFTSLYPSIMVKYNISPETIFCECCTDSKIVVPKVNYHFCEKRTGLIPKVLEPVVQRRIEYKRMSKEGGPNAEIYAARSNVLKWVLVTCFGYTGYKNARFGRIECHESINGFGREIMLQASQVAELYDYEIIHGIVDSLWLKPNGYDDHERVVRLIAKYTGLPLSLEGVYKWIVFPPNKGNEAGALNRYYGLFEDGELKVRGIELRRHDSPQIIRDLQRDALKTLSSARNSKEFLEKIPAVLDVLKRYARSIEDGEYPLKDLILTKRISRGLYEYEQFNDQVAALRQLKDEGVDLHAGEMVRYMICDSGSKDYRKRVKLLELLEGDEKYDTNRYLEIAARAVESILLPFGYGMEKLLKFMKTDIENSRKI